MPNNVKKSYKGIQDIKHMMGIEGSCKLFALVLEEYQPKGVFKYEVTNMKQRQGTGKAHIAHIPPQASTKAEKQSFFGQPTAQHTGEKQEAPPGKAGAHNDAIGPGGEDEVTPPLVSSESAGAELSKRDEQPDGEGEDVTKAAGISNESREESNLIINYIYSNIFCSTFCFLLEPLTHLIWCWTSQLLNWLNCFDTALNNIYADIIMYFI